MNILVDLISSVNLTEILAFTLYNLVEMVSFSKI